ncbi:hypothetical protein O3602_02850 [Streptococcus sp. 27098_8_186]|jgi:hypothetical protein|uniref:DUF6731 family protein n=1 Tax=Streptococcus sp. 27098_8_186 TaxID=3003650 RepID=UPI00352D23BF
MVAYGDDNRKKVKFLYFQTRVEYRQNNNIVHEMYDLTTWCSDVMASLSISDKNYEFGGDTIRLQNMHVNHDGLLELRFTRLSEIQTSYVARKTSDMESDFILEENEYPAQDTMILFDPENCVAMVQRNIQGLSIHGIIEYINYFWNLERTDKQKIDFLPIVSKEIFQRVRRCNGVKKLTIKTANTFDKENNVARKVSDSLNGVLEKIINDASPLNGLNIEVSFVAAPRTKEEILDIEEVDEIMKQIEENPHSFSKAHMSILNEYNKIEPLNLLNALIFDTYEFTLPPKQRLNPESVLFEMKRLYLGDEYTTARKHEINRTIQ